MNIITQLNSIQSDEDVKRIVDLYCSDRDFYTALTHTSSNKVKGLCNPTYRNQMYVFLFQKWRNNLTYLDSSNIVLPKYKEYVSILVQYIQSINPKTYKEVVDALDSELVSDSKLKRALELFRFNRLGEFSSWTHIDSSFVMNGTHQRQKIEHRLYLNCDSTCIHQLALEILKKCHERHIRYYFKFSESASRDDSIVFYCDTKHLPVFIRLIDEVVSENHLLSHIQNPPVLTGKINHYIGYGSEPKLLDNGENTSFNEKRKNHLTKCIEEESLLWIHNHLNSKVKIKNYSISYQEYLVRSMSGYLKEKLLKYATDVDKCNRGYTKGDLLSKEYYHTVNSYLRDHFSEVLNCIRNHEMFTIPFCNGTITFYSYDFESILKKQIRIISRADSKYYSKIRSRIYHSSMSYDIDPDHYSIDLSKASSVKSALLEEKVSVDKNKQFIKK